MAERPRGARGLAGGGMESVDLRAMRAESAARDAAERRAAARRRAALVLVQRWLCDQGYLEAQERLARESGVCLKKVDVADNVSLESVLVQFEEYHELKFGRPPKLVRNVAPGEGAGPEERALGQLVNGAARARERRERGAASAAAAKQAAKVPSRGCSRGPAKDLSERRAEKAAAAAAAAAAAKENIDANQGGEGRGEGFGLDGKGMEPVKGDGGAVQMRPRGGEIGSDGGDETPEEFFQNRMLKPLPDFGSEEMRDLGAALSRDIFMENPNVYWKDVAGQEGAKKLLQEAVVLPSKYPQLFKGLLCPWKGVLLYGPPGTGKTMLAKAVATECKTTFFNISASSVISKWRGDSEKLVRVLFELARHHAPSTIFLDEIDALMTGRGGSGEHEASRRMKTEILIQMDGLVQSSSQDKLVFVLAATNLPWELDMALMRRLEKRILVPLPDLQTRTILLENLFDGYVVHEDFGGIAARTGGFSGADIKMLCKECAMRPLRRVLKEIDSSDSTTTSENVTLGPILQQDVAGALESTKPSAQMLSQKYEEFNRQFGQNI